MTRYAIDESRSELVAIWETGYGAVAIRVAPLAVSIEPRRRLALAAELSGLSRALWRCYTHPASAAGSLALNTEGWRREQTRNEFASVTAHIRKPNLPEGNSLMVSYDPVEECAHRVGRCLHAAGTRISLLRWSPMWRQNERRWRAPNWGICRDGRRRPCN